MDTLHDILVAFLMQIVFTLGIIIAFGLLISFCNKHFYANFKSHAHAVCCATGFIGTPVHEMSHAVLCIIFGHKIKEIKLFSPSKEDGTMGYVHHTYNKRNIYQRIGNFFIGVAPIIVISVILYLLAYFLLPGFVSEVNNLAGSLTGISFTSILNSLWGIVKSFFSYIGSWHWWVFLLAGFFLALHMTLSTADIKGAAGGMILLLLIILIVDIILGFASPSALNSFTNVMVMIGGYLICFMVISLIISVILLMISYIARIFIKH